jgi:hypothetical protein
MSKNFIPNARFTTLAQGSFVNVTAGGTGSPVAAGPYAYHSALFLGTIGNTGTITVYGHTDATGGGTTALGSLVFGSGNGGGVGFEFSADTLTALGTGYAFVSAQISVPAGGTLAGALTIVSTQPRSASGSINLVAFGSLYN